MARFGYDWEAHEVTTDDNYILTTFRILGQTGQPRPTSSKATVLCQHGNSMDGSSFFEYIYVGTPFILQLVDAGYDVWVGNNRGTDYSQGHQTLDSSADNEYWNFSWAEMGLYDDTANIKLIKEKT